MFYVFGGLGLIWSIPWFFLVSEHPETHPRISLEEKQYIMHHCSKKVSKVGWYYFNINQPMTL